MEHTTSKPSYADLAQMRQLKQNFSKGANMGKGKEKGGPKGIMAGIENDIFVRDYPSLEKMKHQLFTY